MCLIDNIPFACRPVWELIQGLWIRNIEIIAFKNGKVILDDNREVNVKDLSSITGVCSFLDVEKFIVYDFSASHLCKNQLRSVQIAYHY